MSSKKKSILSGISYKGLYVLLGVMVMAMVIAAVIAVWAPKSFTTSVSQAKEAVLILAFENEGRGREFQGEVVDNMTILDALIASAQAGDIDLDYKFTADNQINILELDGFNGEQKKLAFFVNGNQIDSAIIHKITLNPGDKVEVKLE